MDATAPRRSGAREAAARCTSLPHASIRSAAASPGAGVRQTLRLIRARIPLADPRSAAAARGSSTGRCRRSGTSRMRRCSIPTGAASSISSAHNLHLVELLRADAASMSLEELSPQRCTCCPSTRTGFPYRTSYYRRSWGFCMRARERASPAPGPLPRRDRSSLAPGSLTYGELPIPGADARGSAVLHACLPSLARQRQYQRHGGRHGAGGVARARAAPLHLSLRLRARHHRLALLAQAQRAAPDARAPRRWCWRCWAIRAR